MQGERRGGKRPRGRRDPNPVCPGVAGRFLWLSGLQDLGRKLWGGADSLGQTEPSGLDLWRRRNSEGWEG